MDVDEDSSEKLSKSAVFTQKPEIKSTSAVFTCKDLLSKCSKSGELLF